MRLDEIIKEGCIDREKNQDLDLILIDLCHLTWGLTLPAYFLLSEHCSSHPAPSSLQKGAWNFRILALYTMSHCAFISQKQ